MSNQEIIRRKQFCQIVGEIRPAVSARFSVRLPRQLIN